MPYLDLPESMTKPLKIQARFITFDRMGPSNSCPLVRVVIVSGYYETDVSGNAVPNAVGFPKFVVLNTLKEFEANLSDPRVQQLMVGYDAAYRQYIIDNPLVPLFAVFDNFMTDLALQLYDMIYLNPVAVEIPSTVTDPYMV